MKKKKRTLYQCFNAKVDMKRIRCGKGYPLSPERVYLDHVQLENGEPLAPKICQQCDHFDSMGPSVPLEERGWHGLKRAGLVVNHG